MHPHLTLPALALLAAALVAPPPASGQARPTSIDLAPRPGAFQLAIPAVPAQTPADPATLNQALRDAQAAHLQRVAIWGGLGLIGGLTTLALSGGGEHPTRRGFGLQTAAWGAVNLALAGWGVASGSADPARALAGALAAEDGWAHLLLVNLGLNVGYAAVGTALVIASGRGLRSGAAVRGHGAAVIVQGLGLLALDGVAWASSSTRLIALRELVAAARPGAFPGSVELTLLTLPFGGG